MTPAQHKLACAMQANPTGRLQDWAKAIGSHITGISQFLRRMERQGYVKSVQVNNFRKRFSLTTKVGCCPTCKAVQVTIKPTADPRTRKITPEIRQFISMSKASNESLAARFGLNKATVYRARRKWAKEASIKNGGGKS